MPRYPKRKLEVEIDDKPELEGVKFHKTPPNEKTMAQCTARQMEKPILDVPYENMTGSFYRYSAP